MTDDSRDTPVVLSRIYTRTGDDGSTALADGARVPKTDPRLAAYADTDEANCAIGTAITLGDLPEDIAACCAGSRTSSSTAAPTWPRRCPRRRPSTRNCASTRAT